MENHAENVHQKLAPDLFLILLNNSKQILHAGNPFENKKFWKMIIKKPWKSQLYFFFRSQSLLIGKVIKNRRCLELVTSRSSSYETSSEKFLYSLLYYLTKFDDVMWSGFWVIAKIASANLCKSIHDIINYSTSICHFESGKCGKEGEKLQKIEYL